MVKGRGIVVAVLILALVLTAGTGTAAGQDESVEGEGLIEVTGVSAVVTLLVGTTLLMISVEVLIHALVRTALRFGVSAFLLAVIFSGWEFDNVAFGVFTGFAEMQNVAFGLAIGNAVSIFGLTLALAAIAFPFAVDIPNDYLAMTVAAPLLLVPVFVSGSFTPALSIVFLAVYVVIFAYIVQREKDKDHTVMQSDQVMEAAMAADGQRNVVHTPLTEPLARLTRFRWFWPVMILISIGGIIVGAEGSAAGVEGILSTWNLTGTFVGVTLVTILFTIDDLLLIIEPLRLGYDEIAVGGVIGSLLFFVTANVGIVGLVGTIRFRWETVFVHLPVLFGFAVLSSYFLWRGKMSRKHGLLLLGLYLLYLLINIQFFATLPVGE